MNSIYLVLDMQNDLVHPEGASGKSPLGEQVRERSVVSNTAVAVKLAREKGIPVAFVRVAFSDDHREANLHSQVFGPIAKNGILKKDSWGGQVHADIGKSDDEWDIVKHRVSPFYQTRLELLLKTLEVDRIYCSGVSTPAVVQATVRDAHDRDFDVVVIEDCCAAPTAQEHANSLASIARFCSVVPLAEAFG
tara:strand:- start:75080 stop:75655 length:576 start_codon:yes stop_codon:yes gene_type:complete